MSHHTPYGGDGHESGTNRRRPDTGFARHQPVSRRSRCGALAGDRLDRLAATADKNPPTLSVRLRTGQDADTIEQHPAYLEMETLAFGEFGLSAVSHRGALGWHEAMPPAAKYAIAFLFTQAEFGLMCPVSMTDSLARTLKRYGDLPLVAAITTSSRPRTWTS